MGVVYFIPTFLHFNTLKPNSYYMYHLPLHYEISAFCTHRLFMRGSQWLRGLRHELSSLARTLGSWVRIPLQAWMSVCVYSVCVVLHVGSRLATG
jgi:hypothetical protein